MAISQAICTAFKKQLLDGDADFDTGGDKFKLALYLSTANLSASATAYTATGESTDTGSGDYTAGGKQLTGQQTSVATLTAIVDFADLSFTGVTLTARGALIYNTSSAVTNAAVAVLTCVFAEARKCGANRLRRLQLGYLQTRYALSSFRNFSFYYH